MVNSTKTFPLWVSLHLETIFFKGKRITFRSTQQPLPAVVTFPLHQLLRQHDAPDAARLSSSACRYDCCFLFHLRVTLQVLTSFPPKLP